MSEQPMDIATGLWRCNTDPEYLNRMMALADAGRAFHRARALRLIELCDAGDPSDFYREVEQFQPDAYVVAELVKMAKANRDSERAKAGAHSAHAENRAMKQDVFDWLDENFSTQKSMDAAADTIKELKLVPMMWRTIRDWVGEWKKLRSTGTP